MKTDILLIKDNKIIDISNIYYFNENFNYPEIKKISPVKVEGKIIQDDYKNPHIKCKIKATINIEDSITLNTIKYPINIEIDEDLDKIYIKNENSLDILTFLWENIVLEVPTYFTEVKDLSKIHGDGWRLIREEDL